MREVWRLLDNRRLRAARQMALDEVMLTSIGNGSSPPTIRFLTFAAPSVLVGYHQDLKSEIRHQYCREQNIDINRRLTGGGALFWGLSEIGWEIITPADHPCLPGRLDEIYSFFCSLAVDGLRALGVDCHFRPRNDIEVGSRKISGTGATSLNGGFLFQGTVLIDYEVEDMLRALRIPTEKLKDKDLESVKDRVTSLKKCLGEVPEADEIITRLADSFATGLGVDLEPLPLTDQEERLCKDLLTHYESEAHIEPVHRQKPARSLYGSTRTPGGIVKVNLKTNANLGFISQAIITGDFLASSPSIIYDLECALKQVRFEPESIQKTVEGFFASYPESVLNMRPNDFSDLMIDVVKKAKHETLLMEPEEKNHLFAVANGLEELSDVTHLLLPYCAKNPDCDYRHDQGCSQCGECSFGSAVSLANTHGLETITIINFEHLCQVLDDLKTQKAAGYIGCCCESFYLKHADTFNSTGIPGMLIDIEQSTCFDLGRELEAQQGRFENHTDLKIDILTKTLKSYRQRVAHED